jgi:hypothetical protein
MSFRTSATISFFARLEGAFDLERHEVRRLKAAARAC